MTTNQVLGRLQTFIDHPLIDNETVSALIDMVFTIRHFEAEINARSVSHQMGCSCCVCKVAIANRFEG